MKSAHTCGGPATLTLATMLLMTAIAGCNQRSPVLDADTVTSPTAVAIPSAPADIVGLRFSPPGDRGGASGIGTIVLDAPAPAGGLVVSLHSADESVVTLSPRQLVVPAGVLSANFQFATRAVTREVNVTITASSATRVVSDYVSVWTPTTQFFSLTADRPGVAMPGQVLRWSSDAGTRFTGDCFNNVISTVVSPPGISPAIVSVGAAPGQPIRSGRYPIESSPNSSYVNVSSTPNCSPTGSFDVRELQTRADGTISSLWVSFEYSCQSRPGAARGALRISNATPRPGWQCVTR